MNRALQICFFLLTATQVIGQNKPVTAKTELAIIPQPKLVQTTQKNFNVNSLKELELPAEWRELGQQLAEFNSKNNLAPIKIVAKAKNIAIRIKKVASLSSESYKLEVNASGVHIEASDYGGLLMHCKLGNKLYFMLRIMKLHN